MILFERALWFHSCAVDAATLLAALLVCFSAIIFATYRMRLRVSAWIQQTPDKWTNGNYALSRGKATGLMYLATVLLVIAITVYFISLVHPFSRQIVRLTTNAGQLDVTWCVGSFEENQRYRATDIEFRYAVEQRGSIAHHMLILERRADAQPIGKLELIPEHRYDFPKLRMMAPAATQEYQRAKGAR